VNDALVPIAGRLGKLLRMLTSPCDGEVLAAARAIVRTLSSASLDMHALADRIGMPNRPNEAEARKIYRAGFMDGLATAGIRTATCSNDPPPWHEMAVWCQQQSDRLLGREREFVDQMAARTVYHEPTEKQGKWLKSIFYRLGGKRP
jgi:hypothetical protein